MVEAPAVEPPRLKAHRVVDRIFKKAECSDDAELVVFVFIPKMDMVISNNGNKPQEIQQVLNWLQERVHSPIAEGAFKIDFGDRLYIFNEWRDDSGIILNGYMIPKTNRIRMVLLEFQERFYFEGPRQQLNAY